MKKLQFDYYMQIDYAENVMKCNYTIKCVPPINSRQFPYDMVIEFSPPSKYSQSKDGLNNLQLYGNNTQPHNQFYYHIRGKADVGLSDFDEVEDENLSMIFRHPHGLNIAGPEIKKYYKRIKVDEMPDPYRKAVYVMNRLYKDFKYQPNTTSIDTSAEEAMSQGHGVCQDYAHIYIALMHLAGIPARYVTGLIVGEGATHAWVEILYQGKWYGFDPTNNKIVFDEHIKLGVGRDARDCMINRGIMHGGGPHTQTIKVNVEEINK